MKAPYGKTRQTGFTLIEVMVTAAIVAILTMIAMPTYKDYVIKGKIPDATSNLASKRVQNEQFFQDNRTYVGATGCTADTTSSQFFDFSCTGVTASAYTLQAVGKGSMAGFSYTLDQSNQKTTASVGTGWTLPAPNNCWATSKGGSC